MEDTARRQVRQSDKLLWKAAEPTMSLYPHLLRVCRQIYQERSEIFYSNTINIRVGEPHLDEEKHPGVLDYVFMQTTNRDADLILTVFSRISRVRIQLFAHHQEYKVSESLRRMLAGLKRVIIYLGDAPEWTNIEIQVYHIYSNRKLEYHLRKAEDLRPFDPALSWLRYLRNLTSVKSFGIEDPLLSTLMTSSEPCLRLDRQLNALEAPIENVVVFMPSEDIQ
jgi:hypothetical protein